MVSTVANNPGECNKRKMLVSDFGEAMVDITP
jgi:hypothetical protein